MPDDKTLLIFYVNILPVSAGIGNTENSQTVGTGGGLDLPSPALIAQSDGTFEVNATS